MGGAVVLLVLETQYFCNFKDFFESFGFFSVQVFFFVPEPSQQISQALKNALLAAASTLFDAPLLPPSGKERAQLKFPKACR